MRNYVLILKPNYVHYLCVDSSSVFEGLQNMHPRSIVMTSGTLKPFDTFSDILGLKFKVQFSTSHVINNSQALVTFIDGQNLSEFKFNHAGRKIKDNLDYLADLVLNTAKNTPKGLLIAFASRNLMNICLKRWEKTGFQSKLESLKPVFIEPKTSM
jgi:regulator of telomere elongation helicase 1